jgi:hypothetical protein
MPVERPTEETFAAARKAIERRVNEIRETCGIDVDIGGTEGRVTISLTSGERIGGIMPLSFELEPRVICRLHALGRLDLALEHEVLAPEWQGAFEPEMRSRAARNLATAERLAHLEAVLQARRSADSEAAITHDCLVVTGSRVIWVHEPRFSAGNPETWCEFSEQLELELMSDPLLSYSPEHHRHVLFCQQCRSRTPILADVYERIVDLDLNLLVGRLQALVAIQRVDDDRIEEFLSRQSPDHNEDWLHASELLGWRAIVAGEYFSRLIELKHLVPESEGRPVPAWSAFTAGNGHPKVVDLFRRLDPELLRAGVASLLLSRIYIDTFFDHEDAFVIPSDGDLRAHARAVPVNDCPDFASWEELLAYDSRDRTDQPFCRELVEVVKMAASTAVAEAGGDNQIRASGEPDRDLLQNTHDMLWVTSQRIEQALPPTPEFVRDSLLRLLGSDVLGRLDPGARQTLIEAERIFLLSLSQMASLREIAQAFEHHVRSRVVPLMPVSFPRGRTLNGWSPSLWEIEQAAERCSGSECDRLKRADLDPGAVANAIRRVRTRQNDLKHTPGQARLCGEEAREIREAWYGLKPGEPGVFHVITGVIGA